MKPAQFSRHGRACRPRTTPHHSWRTLKHCLWPGKKVTGQGRFVMTVKCSLVHGHVITLFATRADAQARLSVINGTDCGYFPCYRRHSIVEISETLVDIL
jgi:hypothetical protein